MPVVGIRELSRNVSGLVEQVERTGEIVLVTRHGRPVAALVRVDRDSLEDLLLAHAPEFIDDMRQADEDLAAGRTQPLEEVMADLAAADEARRPPARRPAG